LLLALRPRARISEPHGGNRRAFAAGGGTDLIARVLSERLSESLKQRFVIINRPGASTNIGTAAVALAQPDGYTLLLTSISFAAIRRSTASSRTTRRISRRSP